MIVYFHGGAYSTGSANSPLLDGRHLAARDDVVVVTVEHRLNLFGYLYLARLDPRFPDSGNCGQLDLILALQWVRDNIAAFGGDPGRVTVFGQSGGGAKIATLMGTPAAARPLPPRRDDERAAGHRLGPAQRHGAGAGVHGAGSARGRSTTCSPCRSARLVEGLAATDPYPGRRRLYRARCST